MLCPRCNAEIRDASKYCSSCGTKIEKTNREHQQNAFEDLDNSLIDAYIGNNKNAIKQGNFSFCAFFIGPLYYLYRKMYIAGMLLYFISFLSGAFFKYSLAFNFCVSIYCGITFKRHYIKYVRNQIKKLKEFSNGEDLIRQVKIKGGTTIIPVVIVIILVSFLMFLLIAFAMLFSVFESHFDESTETSNTTTIKYNIPAGFYPDENNTSNFSFYETDDSYCSFYVSSHVDSKNNNENSVSVNGVESMSVKKKEVNEYGSVYINGQYWHFSEETTNISSTYELTTYKDGINYKVSYFFIRDVEHTYCEDSYEAFKESLIFE